VLGLIWVVYIPYERVEACELLLERWQWVVEEYGQAQSSGMKQSSSHPLPSERRRKGD